MVRREHIGGLALHFTAGAAAGTLLLSLSGASWWLPGTLLPLLLLLLLGLLKTEDARLVFPAFLVCGLFCVLTDALPGPGTETFLQRKAAALAGRLRTFIDSVPFPSGHTAPLLKAFLTGDRSGLSRETVQVFRDSGASHLLALSGLHMGILYVILSKGLWILGNSLAARRFRFAVTVLSSGFFTLMTGASPSITRAFLFIVLNETARLTSRARKPLQVYSAALLIQLVLTPPVLRSVGFQLSYLAMAGIFLLYPRLEAWYPKGPRFDPLRSIWQAAALSISCQVFTGPLAWLRFHTFPTHFLLTNLLAMPLTSLLMGTAVATLGLQAAGLCPDFLLQGTDLLATGLLFILSTVASL